MDQPNSAAVTAATGSVDTPEPQTTPLAPEQSTAPTSRDQRRSRIADWLKGAPAAQDSNTASAESGQGSPPEGQSGASADLSQSTPPDDASTAEPSATDAGETEAEPETTSEPDDKPLHGQWPKAAVERVRKLKDQKQALKAEIAKRDQALESVQAEVRELRQAIQKSADGKAPTQDQLGNEVDPDVIQTRAAEAENVVAWADDLLDDLPTDPDRVSSMLEAEGLKAPDGVWTEKAMRDAIRGIKANARQVVQAAPKRLEFIRREDQALTTAMQLEPQLADPESPIAKQVAAVIAARPAFRDMPDWPLFVTAGLVGLQVLQERRQKPAKPAAAATPKPVPKAPRLPGAPRSSMANTQVSEVDVIRERALKPGATREDRRALIKAQLLAGGAKQA